MPELSPEHMQQVRLHGVDDVRVDQVAAPSAGPRDVIGDSKAGVLHEDLRTACLKALELRREDAVARASLFSWRAATEQFVSHLHPRQLAPGLSRDGAERACL